MSRRTQRRFLIAVVAFGFVMDLLTAALTLHTRSAHPDIPLYDFVLEAAIGGVFLVAVTLILVIRVPEHPVTWLLVASGTAASLQQVFGALAVEALSAEHLAGGTAPLALSSVFQSWWVILLLLMVVIFPTGKPLPGWLGRVVWLIPGVMLLAAYDALTLPLEQGEVFYEPLLRARSDPAFITIPLTVVTVVGSVAHVIVRYARSRGVERQQLKWFAYTFVVGIALLVSPGGENDVVGAVLWTLVPVSIVGSIATAILRYRLYDIDRIISRTVSYALLVGVLALFVLGVVGLLAAFLPSDDPLVVAVATLAVAALFNPMRRRVQRVVDRRFNRSHYDAEKVIAAFAASLRDRVDPDTVVEDWIEVVSERCNRRESACG